MSKTIKRFPIYSRYLKINPKNPISYFLAALTPFAQAMPEKYRDNNTVKAYREYYIGEKQHLATWKKRGAPKWWETRYKSI